MRVASAPKTGSCDTLDECSAKEPGSMWETFHLLSSYQSNLVTETVDTEVTDEGGCGGFYFLVGTETRKTHLSLTNSYTRHLYCQTQDGGGTCETHIEILSVN